MLESTKADDIALVLEDEIVSGAIPPGTVLRQEQLSERFDVSRTPIREALRRLAALGLVSFVPNRGARVRTISRDELHEAFLVRAELESLVTAPAVDAMYARNELQHRAIREAFAAGSADGARSLARKHVLASGELLEAILDYVDAQAGDRRARSRG